MLGDVIELSVVVKDMDEAIGAVHAALRPQGAQARESKEFGFLNAILPTGIGHIELLQPTDPSKAVGKFLAKNGEGVYLVGFECKDVPGSVAHLKKEGARVAHREGKDLAWVHPRDANGLFVELRHREKYT